MTNYRMFCTLILAFTLTEAHAQYRKYKSKTSFDQDSPQPQKAAAPAAQTAPTKDFFDRNNGRQDALESSAEQSRYVNLNFETAFGPEVVTDFKFQDTNLMELITYMQKLTGINLIWDKDVKGKISIVAQNPITVGDAWRAFITALNVNGYSLVKSGAFYKVVTARDARQSFTKLYKGAYYPDLDNFIMKIVPVKHIDVEVLRRQLRTFNTKYGRLIGIKDTNTLLIMDTGANVKKYIELLKLLDVPGHKKTLHLIPVKNSSAEEIVKILNTILKETSTSKVRRRTSSSKDDSISKVQAEPRTNSIIALTDNDGYEELKELINKLDVKVASRGSGKVHVYYLNYSDSEKLAKTLTSLVQTSTTSSARRTTSRFSRAVTTTANTLFNAEVKITADPENNALVITASPTDWLTLQNVIAKLDIPREQVFVEGIIMETNVSRQRDFGISLVGVYGTGGAGRAGFSGPQSNFIDLLNENITNLSGLFIGGGVGANKEITIGDSTVSVKSVNGLIKAIAADNNTNVLATPQILVQDNVEAEFEVGEQVPVTEINNNENGAQQNFKLQDVTMKLKIKPQINKVTRFIKLDIDQNIKDFSQRNTGSAGLGVGTTVRRHKTTVVCRDQDTIAMGGLMRDQAIQSVSKVPLLGDIPVLGWLFKQRSNVVSKVNLLFFLTPKILAPYGKHAANTMKDVLNRRSHHLKKVHAEDDPFATTSKNLYKKAEMQAEAPLYDKESGNFYKNQNQDQGIGQEPTQNPSDDQVFMNIEQREIPNYRDIYQKYANKR